MAQLTTLTFLFHQLAVEDHLDKLAFTIGNLFEKTISLEEEILQLAGMCQLRLQNIILKLNYVFIVCTTHKYSCVYIHNGISISWKFAVREKTTQMCKTPVKRNTLLFVFAVANVALVSHQTVAASNSRRTYSLGNTPTKWTLF